MPVHYCLPTFTGLGMRYLSYVPQKYKINNISTLINWAYNICSSWSLFDGEMKFY